MTRVIFSNSRLIGEWGNHAKTMTLLQVTRTVPALSALHPTAHLLRAHPPGLQHCQHCPQLRRRLAARSKLTAWNGILISFRSFKRMMLLRHVALLGILCLFIPFVFF